MRADLVDLDRLVRVDRPKASQTTYANNTAFQTKPWPSSEPAKNLLAETWLLYSFCLHNVPLPLFGGFCSRKGV